MAERCDFYSEDEYQYALLYEQEELEYYRRYEQEFELQYYQYYLMKSPFALIDHWQQMFEKYVK